MKTQEDFMQLIDQIITDYPAIIDLYKTQAPQTLLQLRSSAAMLAHFSTEVETGMMEVFQKVRDETVLADAAMRGIIPKSKPSRVELLVKNNSQDTLKCEYGRYLVDAKGYSWVITVSNEIAPNSEGLIQASQYTINTIEHEVKESEAFYSIEIPKSADESYFSGILVKDKDGEFEYRYKFTNIEADDRIYHIEADDRQRIYVRFGFDGYAGYQPKRGDIITLNIAYSFGEDALPKSDDAFFFSAISTAADSFAEFSIARLLNQGENPISIKTMRDLARYPSIYRREDVQLGAFEFSIRQQFPSLRFISVWNERHEEKIRGYSLLNINRLFISVVSSEMEEEILNNGDTSYRIDADEKYDELTGVQKAIKNYVNDHNDNSYYIVFYPAIRTPIKTKITASVSANYTIAETKSQISNLILSNYSDEAFSKRSAIPTQKDITELLIDSENGVEALKVGKSDLQVVVGSHDKCIDSEIIEKPENWYFISQENLIIDVSINNVISPLLGY